MYYIEWKLFSYYFGLLIFSGWTLLKDLISSIETYWSQEWYSERSEEAQACLLQDYCQMGSVYYNLCNDFDDDDFGFACIFILLRRHSRMCRMWRLLCWCYSISINGKHGLKGRFSVWQSHDYKVLGFKNVAWIHTPTCSLFVEDDKSSN